jgi:hypothetical protein
MCRGCSENVGLAGEGEPSEVGLLVRRSSLQDSAQNAREVWVTAKKEEGKHSNH